MKESLPVLLIMMLFMVLSCKKNEVGPAAEAVSDLLGPSIGLSTVPLDADVICPITPYIAGEFETFEGNALQAGTLARDFTLYNSSGTAFNLENIVREGKPVLLVSGSYTCPVFRYNVDSINQIVANFGSQLSTYVIYVVEAHPTEDKSPYADSVWVTNENMSEGILYPQPSTYEERKNMVAAFEADMSLNCEILLDGPCNEFWTEYGEAPNRAYLIDTKGKIYAVHGWFSGEAMTTSISALLAE
jgi:peroxiredoxin